MSILEFKKMILNDAKKNNFGADMSNQVRSGINW